MLTKNDIKNNIEKISNKTGLNISEEIFYSGENITELERRISDIENERTVLKEHDLIEND
ncbi:MAG: antitoxin [Ruminococcus sp.]|nr:antitoxin [Ruminococcus sp.]MDE7098292.1 antitoxin [Ruminococcus sp.]